MSYRGLSKINNPFVMMAISITISELAYVGVSYLFGYSIFPFWVAFTAVVSGSISFTATKITYRMMTRIEEQNEELERLNLLNQELFSTISHDIRSPLTAIILLLDMVKSNTMRPEEVETLVNDLTINVDHLINFLDELLIWSKHQIDKKPLKTERIDTKPIIEDIILLYSRIITAKGIHVKIHSISSSLIADKGSYSFVVRNVLQNAIKFTPKGGTIFLNVKQQNGNIVTSIKDEGVGMDSSKIDRILNEGSYVSTIGTNDEIGVGFGLRACLTYLKKQDGVLEITSEKNHGTTVSITLPRN